MPTPNKVLVLVDTRIAADNGGVQQYRAGDVLRAVDFDAARFSALWTELSASNLAVSYDSPTAPLVEAVANVEALRLRAGAVEEGASSELLYQALV